MCHTFPSVILPGLVKSLPRITDANMISRCNLSHFDALNFASATSGLAFSKILNSKLLV